MKDQTWGTVAIAASGPIARLRLTRPAERNAISGQMIDELRLALNSLSADDECRLRRRKQRVDRPQSHFWDREH